MFLLYYCDEYSVDLCIIYFLSCRVVQAEQVEQDIPEMRVDP
jgi:hypothetical protein